MKKMEKRKRENILRLGKSVSSLFTCFATSFVFIFVPIIVRSVEDPLGFPSSPSDEGPLPMIFVYNSLFMYRYIFLCISWIS